MGFRIDLFELVNLPAVMRGGLSCILLCAAQAFAQGEPVRVEQHYDNVLGTSMDVTVHGPDAARMEAALERALAEIARLEAILSTWQDDSDLMRLNRARSGEDLPAELVEVATLCEHWRERSNGVFSCRLGQIAQMWKVAEQRQELPVVLDLLTLARQINQSTVAVDPERRSITLGEGIDLEPSGLAKGYIIDKAMALLRTALPDAVAIKLDIGGDAVYWGTPPGTSGWDVKVADATVVADNGAFIAGLALTNTAVATSGHTSRTFTIGRISYSHIFDTRRGWPLSDGAYAVATAPDATTADAVATILAAQAYDASRQWAENLEDAVQVMLVDRQGRQWNTPGWVDLLGDEVRRQLRANISMTLDYNIPRLRERAYNRPYVAIWVSDEQGRVLQHLLLLGGEQRWANSNSVWWRRTGGRGLVDGYNVTRPTRGPGDYQLIWDGRDGGGTSLLEGNYLLNVEAARQDGGHDYVRTPFTIAPGTSFHENPGQGEVGPFSFTLDVAPAQ